MRRALLVLAMGLCACSPASVSRIGPGQPARGKGCDVEVLEPGLLPTQPYRDVGMVTLDNCQDYRHPPCLDWLVSAACELGGQVAYVQESTPAAPEVPQMRFKVMVGAYAGEWLGDPNDPLLRSRTCEPPCGPEQVCQNRTCISASAPPCPPVSESAAHSATRCTD